MLRSVGLDNILTSVLCLRQGWYVVYQLVRKVHPFMLRGIWGIVVFFGFLVSSLCFVHAGGLGFCFFPLGVHKTWVLLVCLFWVPPLGR